jgi:uncharacterized membrane protein YfcA
MNHSLFLLTRLLWLSLVEPCLCRSSSSLAGLGGCIFVFPLVIHLLPHRRVLLESEGSHRGWRSLGHPLVIQLSCACGLLFVVVTTSYSLQFHRFVYLQSSVNFCTGVILVTFVELKLGLGIPRD